MTDNTSAAALKDMAAINDYASDAHLIALWRMGNSGDLPEDSLYTVKSLLRDDDWRVRWLALRVLARYCAELMPPFDPEARVSEQLRELRQLPAHFEGRLFDSEPEVRALAARCMLMLGPTGDWKYNGRHPYGELIEALGDPYTEVSEPLQQLIAEWIILTKGSERERVFYDLLKALEEGGEITYFQAQKALRDTKDASFMPAMKELERQHAEHIVRSQAVVQVFKLAVKPSLPLLTATLADRDSPWREEAFSVLQELGPQAAPAVPQLASALLDGDLDLARSAFYVLDRVGPAVTEAVPQLLQLIERDRANLRSQAIQLLYQMGGDAGPEAAYVLLTYATDEDDGTEALKALKNIAPAVYDEYLGQVNAVLKERQQAEGSETARYAWTKLLASQALHSRVASLYKQQPGKPMQCYRAAESSDEERSRYLNYWLSDPIVYGDELADFLPGLGKSPAGVVPTLWGIFELQYVYYGYEWQPEGALPVIAQALAAHDPQAYQAFKQLAQDSDERKRRLGLYSLAYCGAAAQELAPELMAKLGAAELPPLERALCARALAATGGGGPYAEQLLVLIEQAKRDALEVHAAQIAQYGYEKYGMKLEDASKLLRQHNELLAEELTGALCTCTPDAVPMLLAKAREKYEPGGNDPSATSPTQRIALDYTRCAALTALGRVTPFPAQPKHAPIPGLPSELPEEVQLALRWVQGGWSNGHFEIPDVGHQDLRDVAAGVEALGRFGCTHERVLRAVLGALKDENADPLQSEPNINDWPAKLRPPRRLVLEAAVEALERLGEQVAAASNVPPQP